MLVRTFGSLRWDTHKSSVFSSVRGKRHKVGDEQLEYFIKLSICFNWQHGETGCFLISVTRVTQAGTPWVEHCHALLALRVTSVL